MACKVPICWFRVNNNTPILDTSRGFCLSFFPAIIFKMSWVNGHLDCNSWFAEFHVNLDRFADRNTEFLVLHRDCISWLILFFTAFDISFFASSIWRRWFNAVLFCFWTIALHALFWCPLSSVLLVLPLNWMWTWKLK